MSFSLSVAPIRPATGASAEREIGPPGVAEEAASNG